MATAKFTTFVPGFLRDLGKINQEVLTVMARESILKSKTICPVRTGALRNSITTDIACTENKQEMSMGSDLYYANYVELGTDKMESQPYLTPVAMHWIEDYYRILKAKTSKLR